jgi:broad specificity phosphatase PhoE
VEIVFIRHGEPDWTPGDRAVNDPGLTARGHEQARRVAERYRGVEVDHLWVSPARRAQETAAPLIEALQMEPVVHDWLVEAATPDWEGQPSAVVRELLTSGRTRSVTQWWGGLPEGEPLAEFVVRVGDGLDATLEALGARRGNQTEGVGLWEALPREGRVLAVCHAGTTGAAVSHLLGVAQVPWAWERLAVGHATATRMVTVPIANAVIFSLRSLGDDAHLEGVGEPSREAIP